MKNREKLKIGIVGHGFVGKATDWGFSKNVKKFIVDPLLGTTIDELKLFNPDLIFISVPTPMDGDGFQDSSIIAAVINELVVKCPDSIKVIKSTVLPSVLEELKEADNRLVYNPEFLREKHANDDFMNAKMIILGGEKKITEQVAIAYQNHSCCLTKEYIFTDLLTASFVKYSINTYLATKVTFFNELFEVFNSLEVQDNWDFVTNIIAKDDRMGHSHMKVPGHDGKKGFGGACFPKDSSAFLKYAFDKKIDLSVLKAAVNTNNLIRSTYETLDKRELEQNVSYKHK